MFHLVKGLYANWNRKEQYSVLILGLDNAGKTTFLETLKNQSSLKSKPLDKITPTVGQNIALIPVPNKPNILLKLWDVGGQESLRAMWPEYYSQCHGIIFVVDSSDSERMDECKRTLTSIVMDDEAEGVPILMLANKQDRPDRLEIQDIKEIFNQIAEHLSARDSRVLPVSSLTGEGIMDALDWMVLRLERNKKNRPPQYK
ncbi:similar to Saccharomyces cerevisiae YPL051W ARL3 GTPase of the Ras superfamily required to recruit Arl1p to the Golgi [Maudiozyma barnettii]|uniref:Similar to Saccharomyces cerevisiae YPL051W ARL3 GTPase of the Ras superfamily required to recruit Arl1p to the Golgi n=1 Tax=Maudiozyma barnettii TaxID=61262 RepID=A0A8H2ZIS8_9SACH|nr:Arf family GTPase ARL3 [Kazachstania barnettii]CAB4255827.1 similar to Saccharomyces cerevisiae YPL051W ARL3 GTPase of the Ras superfamily required to recruit Arl1p to the Golgi [Kazachstania barnettii]CAD1784388.1 similar to Saccharomyces cerevisiae YPL051W ARL3 GTPase of the Ras superfamily required to recruit Arl1p to the Golgi [Kazachstania barnettii]